MEIFDVFKHEWNRNYPAAGEFFLENVILKVSQTHFFKDFQGGPMPPPLASPVLIPTCSTANGALGSAPFQTIIIRLGTVLTMKTPESAQTVTKAC